MRNKKTLIGIVFIVVVFQFFILKALLLEEYQYPFCNGITFKEKFQMLEFSYLFFPLIFYSFFFSQYINDLTVGYGKLYVIRKYSKKKLILIKMLKQSVFILFFIAMQFSVFTIWYKDYKTTPTDSIIRSFIIYFLVLYVLVLITDFLELFIQPQVAVFINIIGTYLTMVIGYSSKNQLVKNICFPSLLFGVNNGSFGNGGVYIASLIEITVICVSLLTINMVVYNKKDVF